MGNDELLFVLVSSEKFATLWFHERCLYPLFPFLHKHNIANYMQSKFWDESKRSLPTVESSNILRTKLVWKFVTDAWKAADQSCAANFHVMFGWQLPMGGDYSFTNFSILNLHRSTIYEPLACYSAVGCLSINYCTASEWWKTNVKYALICFRGN